MQLIDPTVIGRLRAAYLRTLIAPMDGMWEGAVIARSTFWSIQDGKQFARHYRTNSDNMLTLLKKQCAQENWTPICSCAADNIASRKAIIKAGFVGDHRMTTMTFS